MTYYDLCRTSIGWCGVVVSHSAVERIFLAEFERESLLESIVRRFPESRLDTGLCRQAIDFLMRYFEQGACVLPPAKFDSGEATDFQRRVWDITSTVAFGQVRTYGWVAERLGCLKAARAVGGALGRNPLPLIVPCHRIVCSSGHLGGFSATGGSGLKRKLLEHEGITFDVQGRVVGKV